MEDMDDMEITENMEIVEGMEIFEGENMDDEYEESLYGSEESITDDTTPTEADLATERLFPWANYRSNVITREVGKALKRAYQEESPSWSWEMSLDFRHTAPRLNFSVYAQTGTLTSHIIGKRARKEGATWVHFWFLRVMFGPRACSRQQWFAELADKHPWMRDEAPGGVVPLDACSIIKTGKEDWVPAAPTRERPEVWRPTMSQRMIEERARPPGSNKTPRASTQSAQETGSVSAETDVWAQLDAADFSEVLNAGTPSKTDEELERLKGKHDALQLAHEALWENHKALEEKYQQQEEKLEKLCTRLVQLGDLVKQRNGG
ncbi:hypothetical protein TgHK011_005639 [Trichoderma gracile]|nr:hypothetical protein TgHK011_005639 [Trichoderma gracile]